MHRPVSPTSRSHCSGTSHIDMFVSGPLNGSEQCKASYSTMIPSDEYKRKFYYFNLLFLNRFYERNRIYRQTDDARKLFEPFNHTMWVEGFEHF